MVDNSVIRSSNHGWFRWVPPATLITGTLLPSLYMLFYYIVIKELGPKYWSWGQIIVSVLLMIVPILSVTNPFIGGILAILVTPAILLGYALMAGMAGLSNDWELLLSIITILFVTGGILSMLCGVRNWLWRRKKREEV